MDYENLLDSLRSRIEEGEGLCNLIDELAYDPECFCKEEIKDILNDVYEFLGLTGPEQGKMDE